MSNNKDWTGNKKTTFVTLGASNHTDHDRAEYDYYATEPKAADLLCDVETFEGSIWENACGEGHLSERLRAHSFSKVLKEKHCLKNTHLKQCMFAETEFYVA